MSFQVKKIADKHIFKDTFEFMNGDTEAFTFSIGNLQDIKVFNNYQDKFLRIQKLSTEDFAKISDEKIEYINTSINELLDNIFEYVFKDSKDIGKRLLVELNNDLLSIISSLNWIWQNWLIPFISRTRDKEIAKQKLKLENKF